MRPKKTSNYEPDPLGFHQEPAWNDERLFDVEVFAGDIHDPCCGEGLVVKAARAAGYRAYGSDLVDRGFPGTRRLDFFAAPHVRIDNIVSNPPYHRLEEFCRLACKLARWKVAALVPLARTVAAYPYLLELPLARVHLLTPRPSMPPRQAVLEGKVRVGNGQADYCWWIFDHYYRGEGPLRWLHRDG